MDKAAFLARVGEYHKTGWRLAIINATPVPSPDEVTPGVFEISWGFAHELEFETIRETVTTADEVPSVSEFFGAAFLYENEMRELFGINVTGIGLEAVLTVVLLLAVFGTAVDSRGPKIGGLAIGFAIAADILVGGPVTGAAMNPARWFGPAVASGFLDNAVVWIVGPLLGAAVAALLYRFVFSAEAMEAAKA